MHAWSAPGESLLTGEPMVTGEDVTRYVEDVHAAARKAVDDLVRRYLAEPYWQLVHVVQGSAPEAITRVAERERVDLIVMGTVARTGIAGFLIGNTAESVFDEVSCSVLAIKPDGFRTPVSLEE
jgi:nucleotide-binding universal stress UspA family protein